jgi:hypothetical protein
MTQYYALLSIVFMIAFVVRFDVVRRAAFISQFCKSNLLSTDEIDQVQRIALACQE